MSAGRRTRNGSWHWPVCCFLLRFPAAVQVLRPLHGEDVHDAAATLRYMLSPSLAPDDIDRASHDGLSAALKIELQDLPDYVPAEITKFLDVSTANTIARLRPDPVDVAAKRLVKWSLKRKNLHQDLEKNQPAVAPEREAHDGDAAIATRRTIESDLYHAMWNYWASVANLAGVWLTYRPWAFLLPRFRSGKREKLLRLLKLLGDSNAWLHLDPVGEQEIDALLFSVAQAEAEADLSQEAGSVVRNVDEAESKVSSSSPAFNLPHGWSELLESAATRIGDGDNDGADRRRGGRHYRWFFHRVKYIVENLMPGDFTRTLGNLLATAAEEVEISAQLIDRIGRDPDVGELANNAMSPFSLLRALLEQVSGMLWVRRFVYDYHEHVDHERAIWKNFEAALQSVLENLCPAYRVKVWVPPAATVDTWAWEEEEEPALVTGSGHVLQPARRVYTRRALSEVVTLRRPGYYQLTSVWKRPDSMTDEERRESLPAGHLLRLYPERQPHSLERLLSDLLSEEAPDHTLATLRERERPEVLLEWLKRLNGAWEAGLGTGSCGEKS